MEDGAPDHRGHSKKYQELNGVDVLPWPEQWPDLNPIEELWQDVEVELGQIWGKVSDMEALEAAVEVAWNTIPEERLEGLIRSRPALIDADG